MRTYEAKLNMFGVPTEELGFKPLESTVGGQQLGHGPAGLVSAPMWECHIVPDAYLFVIDIFMRASIRERCQRQLCSFLWKTIINMPSILVSIQVEYSLPLLYCANAGLIIIIIFVTAHLLKYVCQILLKSNVGQIWAIGFIFLWHLYFDKIMWMYYNWSCCIQHQVLLVQICLPK